MDERTPVAILGAGRRGRALGRTLRRGFEVDIRAVCDVDPDRTSDLAGTLEATETYVDHETMLEAADIEAVLVTTPMPFHAEHSVAALECDLDVFCEVPAAVSEEGARAVVATARDSEGSYTLGENYGYRESNVLVGELVAAGLFGEPYYAEGEYLHELRAASWEREEPDRWRRQYQTGRNGVTYPTHSLGPVLDWLAGDRVARVACAGSGHHYTDPDGDPYEQEDTTVLLGETEAERLVKIRMDMLSERPHAMDNYQLQGTEGCYESARHPGGTDRVWLSALDDDGPGREWHDLSELVEYLPDRYRDPPPAAREAGHGGGDYYVLADFLASVAEEAPPPVGVHEAMDMTLPGLRSQASIANDGVWVTVPDSREW